MILHDHSTYYDILEVSPDASPQEIRNAYLRAKAAYAKDSPALYSLVTEKEAEVKLKSVEEAYHVLSNPEKRREYDRHHGLLSADEDFFNRNRPASHQKIVSIDRVPPMKPLGTENDILVPPTTDFTPTHTATPQPTQQQHIEPMAAAPAAAAPHTLATPPAFTGDRPTVEQILAAEIAEEKEWKGAFLRKVRLARNISIEEISESTKITKTYIAAIEEDNFAKLPAPVFLRGFVTQIARTLRLPGDKVTPAYMARAILSRTAGKT